MSDVGIITLNDSDDDVEFIGSTTVQESPGRISAVQAEKIKNDAKNHFEERMKFLREKLNENNEAIQKIKNQHKKNTDIGEVASSSFQMCGESSLGFREVKRSLNSDAANLKSLENQRSKNVPSQCLSRESNCDSEIVCVDADELSGKTPIRVESSQPSKDHSKARESTKQQEESNVIPLDLTCSIFSEKHVNSDRQQVKKTPLALSQKKAKVQSTISKDVSGSAHTSSNMVTPNKTPKSPKSSKSLDSSSPFKFWKSSSQLPLVGRKSSKLMATSGVSRKLNFGNENGTKASSSQDDKLSVSQLVADVGYHVGYFTFLFHEILKDKSAKNLLNEEEVNTINTFRNMERGVKEFYLRMYSRKFQWHRIGDINYDEKFSLNTKDCIEKLAEHGFLETDNSIVGVGALLELMKVPEIKSLCKELSIKHLNSNKQTLCNYIVKYSKEQKTFGMNFQMVSSENGIKQRIRNLIGPCFKLSEGVRKLFCRLELLFRMMFSGENESAREDNAAFQMAYFGTFNPKIYPEYHIDKTIEVFSCRDDLLRFEEAVELESELAAAADEKEWDVAEGVIDKIKTLFLFEMEHKSVLVRQLPVCLRRFSAGSSLAYSLYLGIEVFRSSKKPFRAIDDLKILLGQNVYLPHYRGRWYNELVSFLKKCERFEEMSGAIVNGLQDLFTDERYRYDLRIQCEKLMKTKKAPDEVKTQLIGIEPPVFKAPVIMPIRAKALEGRVGRKTVYVVDDEETQGKTYSSVEEIAINHYKRNGYLKGIHAENSVAVTLFGVLMWDIIYECPVPYVFRTPYQTRPLDLDSGEFYYNRKLVIDQRLEFMHCWGNEDISEWVKEVYDKHKDKTSIVNWMLFSSAEEFLDVVECMGWKVALQICEKMAKSFQSARSGFPDLIVWTPGQKMCAFVEVKGGNDRLATHQKLWLHHLIEMGGNAQLCNVSATGSKSLKRKRNNGMASPAATPAKQINLSNIN